MKKCLSVFQRNPCLLRRRRCSQTLQCNSLNTRPYSRHSRQVQGSSTFQMNRISNLPTNGSQPRVSFHLRRSSTQTSLSEAPKPPAPDYENDKDEDNEILMSSRDDAPFQFREQLNNWYRANFDVSLKDSFEVEQLAENLVDDTSPTQNLWAATFVCPITGDRSKGDFLRGPSFYQKVDDKYYFTTKKVAIQSAARMALYKVHPEPTNKPDNVLRSQLQKWYMENHQYMLSDDNFSCESAQFGGKKKGGTWWTSSFVCPVTSDTFPAIEIPQGKRMMVKEGKVWFRRKRDALAGAVMAGSIDKEESTVVSTEDTPKESPQNKLKAWYQEHHGVELSNDDFDIVLKDWKGSGGSRWTAAFLCPVSGKSFNSGRLLLGEPSAQVVEKEGEMWYRKKHDAILAASCQALDVLKFEKTGITEPRFCEADPEHYHAHSSVSEATKPVEFVRHAAKDFEDTFSDSSEVIDESEAEEDEDDFVIQFIPRRVGEEEPGALVASTTLDLVTQAWIETTNNSIKDGSADVDSPMNLLQRRKHAIERATTWLEQQKRNEVPIEKSGIQFDNVSTPTNKNIAKKLLESLATAHSRVPREVAPSGIQGVAKSMIEFLHDTESDLDASCYAAYIQCLEGESFSVAKKASSILQAMISGVDRHGRRLPKPTIDVFNSVLQRKAEAGIKVPVSEFDEWPVNQQTFSLSLSAIAFAPPNQKGSSFDSLYILDCVEKLKSLAVQRADESLRVDIDILNAPMRWSGDSEAGPSSRSSYPDDIYQIFSLGAESFPDFNELDPLVHEASDLNDWLQSIEKGAFGADVEPNIETYESVIQAWIRTGTMEGIDRAERLIDALCVDTDKPRVRPHTLAPLMAALVYTGQRQRIDNWLNRLESMDGDFSKTELQVASIVVRALDKSGYQGIGRESLSTLKDLETEYTHSLNGGSQKRAMDPYIFSLVVQSWWNQYQNTADPECSQGVKDTLLLFDKTLSTMLRREQMLSSPLVRHAPVMYYYAIKTLLAVNGNILTGEDLTWTEEVLRRSGEQIQLARRLDPDTPVTGAFKYNSQDVMQLHPSTPSWKDIFDVILRSISKSKSELKHCRSDVLRLLVLISEIIDRNIHSLDEVDDGTGRVQLEQLYMDYGSQHKGPLQLLFSSTSPDNFSRSVASKPHGKNDTSKNRHRSSSRKGRKKDSRKRRPSAAQGKRKNGLRRPKERAKTD